MSLGGGRASSTIRVNIIGDADSLARAASKGEKTIAGFSANAVKLGAAAAAAFAADALIGFANTALAESDRIGDAIDRLTGQLGDELAAAIDATADDFTHLGQSRQDILELAAGFADTATALGVGDASIANWATNAAAIAAALELQGVGDAASNIDAIGKAAGGSERAMRELGINLDTAEVEARALADSGKDTPDMLTDSEIAGARYALVLEDLSERLGGVDEKNGDLEQSQGELQAKWETLTGRIGEAIEGPLNDLLTWILSGIDGLGMLGQYVDFVRSELRKTLGPVFALTDALADLIDAFDDLFTARERSNLGGNLTSGGRPPPRNTTGGPDERGDLSNRFTTVNVYGGDPLEVERAVRRAATDYTERNGATYPV